MPVPLPENTVVSVNFFSELCGQRVMNTFHYQLESVPNPALDYKVYLDELATKLETVDTGLVATLNALYPTNLFTQYMRIQPIYIDRLRYAQYTLAVNGGAGSDSDSANVAFSVKRTAEAIGPQGVGRVQIPLCNVWRAEGYVDLAAINTIVTAFANAMLATIVTEVPTATWIPVLFGAGFTEGVPYTHVSPLVSAIPEDTIRVMRRRTVRLGE